MNFDAVYSVDKEFDKDAFLRELLIRLALNNNTPVDVVEADFKEVTESIKEVVVCTAQVDGTCTASIGYDRQESYIDYEKYKEKVGNTYVTRERPVTKYRTVTDWQPYTTQYSGEEVRATYNSSEGEYDDDAIVTAITTADDDSVRVEGSAELNQTALYRAVRACEFAVELKVRFPGDRNKDARYNSNSEIKRVSCYKLPYYEVEYVYNNVKYIASCFACGDININSEMPPNDMDITEAVKEKTAGDCAKQKLTWRLFAISIVAAAVLCFAIKFAWLFPIPIVLLLKAKKDSDTYKKRYTEYSDSLSKNVAQSKISALKKALENRGYRPLSAEDDAALENSAVPGAKPLKSIKGRVIWSWILTIILTIVSVFTISSVHNEAMHSPDQVEIKVTSKESVYDPDASPYINGCYYVYFDYEIEAKKTGVDYIEMKVYVSDKDGNDIGFIRSDFSSLRIEAGEKDVVETYLQENQPEKNEFFTELYNADFEDLEFEFEIGTIRFSDGEYYYNENYDKFN